MEKEFCGLFMYFCCVMNNYFAYMLFYYFYFANFAEHNL